MLRKASKTCKLANEKDSEAGQESLLSPSTQHHPKVERSNVLQKNDEDAINMKRKVIGFDIDGVAESESRSRRLRGTTKELFDIKGLHEHPTRKEEAGRVVLLNEIPQERKECIEASSYHDKNKMSSKLFSLTQSKANDEVDSHPKIVDTDHDPSVSSKIVLEGITKHYDGENTQIRLRQEERRVAELTEKIRKLQTQHQEEIRVLKVEINALRRKVDSDEKIQKLQHKRAFKAEKDAQALRKELQEIKTK